MPPCVSICRRDVQQPQHSRAGQRARTLHIHPHALHPCAIWEACLCVYACMPSLALFSLSFLDGCFTFPHIPTHSYTHTADGSSSSQLVGSS